MGCLIRFARKSNVRYAHIFIFIRFFPLIFSTFYGNMHLKRKKQNDSKDILLFSALFHNSTLTIARFDIVQ
ncbi:MAG: hypothetical protein DBY27_08805 [Clostridiaceae bacterium]|nr:MAG: hypothetical protein DBY27_08805 [Clostridiaceae bacterium]